MFPHRLRQRALLAPVVSVRPQESTKLTLRQYKGINHYWNYFLPLHLRS